MSASTTEITGLICDADGTPKVGAVVRATIDSTEQDQGGQVGGSAGITSTTIEAFTEDDGTFSIGLVSLATLLLEIPAINLRKDILVPGTGPVDFTTLI